MRISTNDIEEFANGLEIKKKLVIVGSFTVQPLLAGIEFWSKQLQFAIATEIAPYGQVLQELVNPDSALAKNEQGLGVILLRFCDWMRELPANISMNELEQHYAQITSELIGALNMHRKHTAVETLLLICPSCGEFSKDHQLLFSQMETKLQDAVAGAAGLQIATATSHHLAYQVDDDQIYDALRDKIGHIPYYDSYYAVLATILVRNLQHRSFKPRKVIVVDCDNTLWQGVVGEVGVDGLKFTTAQQQLHQLLIRLSKAGLLICLCSKNEEFDVWPVFEREDFALQREHIVIAMINWLPKSQNIHNIAARLNLGLDSFIFIDDNPVECAEVRAGCPEVLVLEWPQENDRALQLINHTWELDILQTTAEDQRRTQLYREEAERQQFKEQLLTFQDFIDKLELEIDVAPVASAELRRCSQLTLRTNQFNFTTKRRKEGELQALINQANCICRRMKVHDRFGDYGLVGLLILELHEKVLQVDTFLLSCRVLGRGVEHNMMKEIARMATKHNAQEIHICINKTKRNVPAREFLKSIIPAQDLQTDDGKIECRVAPATLANIEFKPHKAQSSTGKSNKSGKQDTRNIDTDKTRDRERQISRCAYELSSVEQLCKALAIKTYAHSEEANVASVSVEIVAKWTYKIFADCLCITESQIKQVDRLDALGCNSFKIVEITVALSQKFPWLPSTLLFEHQSVSSIVDHITNLATTRQTGFPTVARQSREATTTDIAVVGMALRCARTNSTLELWELLKTKQTTVRKISPQRKYFLRKAIDDQPYWAALLDNVDAFDSSFFGIPPREAKFLDPQLRLFLEVAWEAMEDAAFVGKNFPDTGVFVGTMYGDYGCWANDLRQRALSPDRCWESFSIANRLSHFMGFNGPSLALDTACSSSATALHLACQAINNCDCSAAVVGGSNLILDASRLAFFRKLGILSPTGKCCAFGADANGTVMGEGIAVVVLKTVDEALQCGDRIYGVIKATAANVGTGTVGFTAPNPQAQAAVIQRCLQKSQLDPRTISYIETHGTGTALGDPIEVRGLELAYQDQRLWQSFISGSYLHSIGSIKPNIGHLEAGAGIVSLIKVLLQLQYKHLLPSINAEQLNPQIPFADIPFAVQQEFLPWEQPVMTLDNVKTPIPRRAAINSFGIGGANVHIIVEEAPHVPVVAKALPSNLFTVSATTHEGLLAHVDRIQRYLRNCACTLQNTCYTANTGRRHFAYRLAIKAKNARQLQGLLEYFAQNPQTTNCFCEKTSTPPKVAFLFPDIGSHYFAMGQSLYQHQKLFRHTLEQCAHILSKFLDISLIDILFHNDSAFGDPKYAPPTLFAVEYSLCKLWQAWGVAPHVVLGRGVGELVAACIAGVYSLEDGLKLAVARGRCDTTDYQQTIATVSLAVPEHTVIISSLLGKPAKNEMATSEYWLQQLDDCGKVVDSIASCKAKNISDYIEVGPHPALLTIARKYLPENASIQFLPSLRKNSSDWNTLLTSVARLYVRGGSVDWHSFYGASAHQIVDLPKYPFQHQSYWLDDNIRNDITEIGNTTYNITWKQQPLCPTTTESEKTGRWLMFADASGHCRALQDVFTARGLSCTLVIAGEDFHYSLPKTNINPCNRQHFTQLWEQLSLAGETVHGVVVLCNRQTVMADTAPSSWIGNLVSSLYTVQSLAAAEQHLVQIWFITCGALAIGDSYSHAIAFSQMMHWGFARVVDLEYPKLFGGIVDIDPEHAIEEQIDALAQQLLAPDEEKQIAFRDGRRLVPRLVPYQLHAHNSISISSQGAYLITGGLGALGLHVAGWLIAKGASQLVLVSRRGMEATGAESVVRELQGENVEIVVVAADISRKEEVDHLWAMLAENKISLCGVIHAAGLDHTATIADMTAADVEAVVAPKLGAWLLHEKTQDLPLDIFVCFSSFSSIVGAKQRAHYSAANAFLDGLVHERQRLNLPALSINWGPWLGGGMASNESLRQFSQIGNHGIEPQQALQTMELLLNSDCVQGTIVDIDWPKFCNIYESGSKRTLLRELKNFSKQNVAGTETDTPNGMQLQNVPRSRQSTTISKQLQQQVAKILGFARPEKISLEDDFFQMGMNSLTAAELTVWLQQNIGMHAESFAVFEYPNINSLTRYLLKQLPPPRATNIEYAQQLTPEIIALQKVAYPYRKQELLEPRWNWMFIESARRLGEKPLVWLYRDHNQLVAQQGSIPVVLKVGQKTCVSRWFVDTYVCKEYRDKAIGTKILLQSKQDVPFNLSLGQDAFMRSIQLKSDWQKVGALGIYMYPLRPRNILQEKSLPASLKWAIIAMLKTSVTGKRLFAPKLSWKPQIARICQFDSEHDQLWQAMSRELYCAVVRDAAFLNWKYVNQPGQQFDRIELRKNGRVVAVAIISIKEPNTTYKYKRAFIVDLVVCPSNSEVVWAILQAITDHCQSQGVDAINFHFTCCALRPQVIRFGYIARKPVRFLLITKDQSEHCRDQKLENIDNWYLTMGDSDIDRP